MRSTFASFVLLCALATPAAAFEPFVIRDIRIEGIQRTEAGTVFSYMPVKVGDTLTEARAAETIRALFATGFFKDVRLEYQGDVLIVLVEERPAIGQLDFYGIKEFDKDQIRSSLKELGLAEGRIYDRALLDKAEQELKRQYLARGKYDAQVSTTVTPLERNRVAIRFDVSEGEVAKIRQINIVGATVFREKDLLSLMNLTTPTWLSWYTKNDQYSRQKLAGDLETLRSYYLNRGYLDFSIDSTQVQISPDKRDIYITISISEGPRYVIGDVKVGGELLLPEETLRKLIKIRSGEVFSRERVNASVSAIADRLGNDGYAFANINAVPEVDKANQRVSFTFLIDPGRRVYVRRVNVAGNTRTRDEVIRREVRQSEGGWYAQDKIKLSQQRLDRLDYFKSVNIETPAVPGTTDQIDMNITVEEKPTGNIMAGAGFSSTEGLVLSGSVTQSNVMGSGNILSVQANTSKINTTYALSFTNPYYTDDGLSVGFDVYWREVDASQLSISSYNTGTKGLGGRIGVPLNETDFINFGLAAEKTTLSLGNTMTAQYNAFVATYGDSFTTLRGEASWARDSLNSRLFPTQGTKQRATLEIGLPGGELQYYKASYQHQWFVPIGRDSAFMLNGDIGLGDGLGSKPLPFFKNFYAGGATTVRGFAAGTVGPKDPATGDALGGWRRVIGNAEYFFPFPGLGNDKSARLSAFFDVGGVAPTGQSFSSDDFRYSAGVGLTWVSPLGPLKFSLAAPLKKENGDKTEMFQFQFGSVF